MTKLRSTRWQIKDLMFLKAVASRFDITVDKIVREGAIKNAKEILKQAEVKDGQEP